MLTEGQPFPFFIQKWDKEWPFISASTSLMALNFLSLFHATFHSTSLGSFTCNTQCVTSIKKVKGSHECTSNCQREYHEYFVVFFVLLHRTIRFALFTVRFYYSGSRGRPRDAFKKGFQKRPFWAYWKKMT